MEDREVDCFYDVALSVEDSSAKSDDTEGSQIEGSDEEGPSADDFD